MDEYVLSTTLDKESTIKTHDFSFEMDLTEKHHVLEKGSICVDARPRTRNPCAP